tara:strand:- start:4014 stop:4391 length:378 start_codon:yes stop_codon:yes gene_type:complete
MSLHINWDKATKKEVRAIRNHLQRLGEGKVKPKCNRYGLCFELSNKYKVDSITAYISTWPKLAYPACEVFPILDKHRAYYQRNGLDERISMWDRRTTVGKLRCELCTHIAAELSKELCEGVYTDV